MTKRMGYIIDLDNPYITLDNNYIETGWWILKEFFKAGLIYEGTQNPTILPQDAEPVWLPMKWHRAIKK